MKLVYISFLILLGACSKQKNVDRKIYGTILSSSTNQPIAHTEFLLATDIEKGVIFNKKHSGVNRFPFSTNENGYFEVVFRAASGSRAYIAVGSAIATGGDPYDGAIWVDRSLSKSETNINVGTLQY